MSEPARSDTRKCLLLSHLLPNFAIFPPEVKKRIPVSDNEILHLGDEDRVVPSHFSRAQTTLQIGQSSVQHRRAVTGPVKTGPGLRLGILMRSFRTRVVLRDRLLILTENVDPEALLGMHVGVGARAVIDADQHK